jgi:hypothetical protein
MKAASQYQAATATASHPAAARPMIRADDAEGVTITP